MKLFVAGATGYTGEHLVRIARRAGHDVVAHVRPGSSSLEAFAAEHGPSGVIVDTTPWEAEAMAATLAEHAPAVVYCLIGTTRARAKREAERTGARVDYDTVDYGLTALLVSALARSGVRARFVYLSAIGVSERAPGAYMQARYKAEQAVQHAGVRWTIVRPSFISGDDRDETRIGERVAAVASNAALKALKAVGGRRLHDRWAPMSGEQLAQALLTMGADPAWEHHIVEGEEIPR